MWLKQWKTTRGGWFLHVFTTYENGDLGDKELSPEMFSILRLWHFHGISSDNTHSDSKIYHVSRHFFCQILSHILWNADSVWHLLTFVLTSILTWHMLNWIPLPWKDNWFSSGGWHQQSCLRVSYCRQCLPFRWGRLHRAEQRRKMEDAGLHRRTRGNGWAGERWPFGGVLK